MVSFILFECCLRLLLHTPESSFNITLLPLRPYREPGSLARSLPDENPVSAGVSRKRVHLFRWRSYFQKAFTGAKKTTSRERLPIPSPRRRNFTTQPPGPGVSRTTGLHRQSLTNHRPHFHYFLLDRTRPAGRKPPRNHVTGANSQTVMTPLWPSRRYATPHHWRNKEHYHGPTHCRPSGY